MEELEFAILGYLAEGEGLTQDEIWNRVDQHAAFRTNWRKVREILSVLRIRDKYITLLPPHMYKITEKGISVYNHNKDLREHEAKLNRMTIEQLSLNVENLRTKVLDYEKNQRLAKYSILIAIVSVIVTAMGLALQLLL